jgi:DNA-binding NtrC family response regulator/tetratricopeptide (TPR) repeat protein
MNQVESDEVLSAQSAGNLRLALARLRSRSQLDLPERRLEAVLLFDLGCATEALQRLDALCEEASTLPPASRYELEFARFSRSSSFASPRRTATLLARLRQLATASGEPRAVSLMHVAVSKLEALRGNVHSAHLHLDIASRISQAMCAGDLSSAINLIGTLVETSVGNIRLSRRTNAIALEAARRGRLGLFLPGLLSNAGNLAVWSGDASAGRSLLNEAREASREFLFFQLAVTDSLAALALFEDRMDDACAYLEACRRIIATHRVPARSWYDLTHQITRCLYFGFNEDWATVINIVNDADPELERRQLKTWRATLLAARARAQARLGLHDDAGASLLAAMRVCPRGAVDPMISIESATGTCLALRGDTQQAHRHFDRALRACDAIEHRYQAWLVTRERASLPNLAPATPGAAVDIRPVADTDTTSLLLSDIASIVTAGHSLDLLAQRIISVLEATPLRSRVSMTHGTANGDSTAPTVAWEFHGSHGCRIELTLADRSITIDIRQLASLEELSLVKSLTDIIASAVRVEDDADSQLWPQAEQSGIDTAVFWSPRMQELLRVAQRLAATDLPILITGETGTGKEVFARLIHEHSRMKRGPFIPFNASAIPRELVESQMFGHRRGAFTGALESSVGVIRSADQGTLFLDEIGDLDPAIQPKLLRFLESGEIHPVGELKPSTVNVRIVAATNARLESLVEQGRFRSDLFYRLRVAALALPPLRERKDEIPALIAHFVRKAVAETNRQQIVVGDDVVAAMLLYDWPGNLRQLSNELRRMVALAEDGSTLHTRDLSPEISEPWFAIRPQVDTPAGPGVIVRLDQPLDVALEDLERAFIERALAQSHGRVTEAAQLLGISRKGLFLKRKKLGLE